MPTQRFVARAAGIALILAGCAACTQAQRAADSTAAAPPPVGDLRWREPHHPANWPGVRAATAGWFAHPEALSQEWSRLGRRQSDKIASLAREVDPI